MKSTSAILDNSVQPIRIVVGYPWDKDDDGKVSSPRKGHHWQWLKAKVESEAKAIKTIAEKREGGIPLTIRIERLRGLHGAMLLDNLNARIERADILVMDIGSVSETQFNCNVLIEVGVAIGYGHHRKNNLFILKAQDRSAPSDLNGFLFSEYMQKEDGTLSLCDDPGFRAALRARIFDIAMERGMIGIPKESVVESNGNEIED